MANTIKHKFSYLFHGVVWNILADGTRPRLFLEIRDVQEKKVSFSALNLSNYEWLWKDVTLEESWWLSMAAVAGERLLFTLYTDTTNPDKKSLLAYDVMKKEMSWWYNGFSFSGANNLYVKGIDARFPSREIILDIFTGTPVQHVEFHLADSQNFAVIRPFQYVEGTAHFETVKIFLQARVGIVPVSTIDYLEFEELIVVSVYVEGPDLANFLYVFNSSGEVLFKEKLGENLKGVGLDTFFIYSDHLIFVKNKNELISCKLL